MPHLHEDKIKLLDSCKFWTLLYDEFMSTIAIALKEYEGLVKRQEKIEAELDILKRIVLLDDERFIKPSVLKRWERISGDLDRGKGHIFDSAEEMRGWLKNLKRGWRYF